MPSSPGKSVDALMFCVCLLTRKKAILFWMTSLMILVMARWPEGISRAFAKTAFIRD